MFSSDQSLWHSFKALVHKVGHFMQIHFKHVTGTVRYIADRVHALNLGAVSQVAHLISRGSTLADQVFDWASEWSNVGKTPEQHLPTDAVT